MAAFISAATGANSSTLALKGTSGSRVSRSRTSSMPQKSPLPRISPIEGWRSCSRARPSPSTSPIAAEFSTIPSSWKASIEAMEAFQEEGIEEHTSELQSQSNLVCRLLLEKKKKKKDNLQFPD